MAHQSKKIFRISGRVIDWQNKRGIAGLRVEAWDKDLIVNKLVGSAMTDEQGAFRIEFDGSYFKELFLDRRPNPFKKIFRDHEYRTSRKAAALLISDIGEAQAA